MLFRSVFEYHLYTDVDPVLIHVRLGHISYVHHRRGGAEEVTATWTSFIAANGTSSSDARLEATLATPSGKILNAL